VKTNAILLLALACAVPSAAQVNFRLKGTIGAADGAALETPVVRTEAFLGARGAQFVGQKEFRVLPNAKGEWEILGLTPGLWIFEAHAKDRLPQVFVLPIRLMTRTPLPGSLNLSYKVPFTLERTDGEFSMVAPAAAAAESGNGRAALDAIAAELEFAANASVLTAAGEIALVVRQPRAAALVFSRAIEAAPTHWRAQLGRASAAMLQADWDTAIKAYWIARDRAPGPYKQALSSAVVELQQIMQVRPGER
jgi:hypothetical protein